MTKILVEPIDNHHPAWGQVLSAILRTGNREAVLLREDGWLSSRQSVLAAFDGDQVVGHLCFRIEPTRCPAGLTSVKSRLDSFAVDGDYADHSIDEMLLDLAEARAKLMRCPAPQLALVAS